MDFTDLTDQPVPDTSTLYANCVKQDFYITEFECDGTVRDYVKIGEKLTMPDGSKYGRIIRVPKAQLTWLHTRIGEALKG